MHRDFSTGRCDSSPRRMGVSGLVGIAIERGHLRFLSGRPIETLLATGRQSDPAAAHSHELRRLEPRGRRAQRQAGGLIPAAGITYNALFISYSRWWSRGQECVVLKATPLGLCRCAR